MRPSRSLTCAVLVAMTLAAVGCGDRDEQQTVTVTAPTASTPDATTPPPDATQPGTTTVAPPATTTTPAPADPAPGGDEQQVRVPASFVVVAPGRLEPPTITVPPFLAIEISVRSDDGRPHRLVLGAAPRTTLDVRAGRRAAVRIRGLRAGQYLVMLDGRPAGALLVGGEVGP